MQSQIQMRSSRSKELARKFIKDWRIYILLLPLLVWLAVWWYKPIGGLLIAFKRFDPALGIMGSDWKGFDNLLTLTSGVFRTEFWQAFRNTFIVSAYGLVFGFPVPIILAIAFSEIRNKQILKVTQTITYLPHFLSEVTVTGIVLMLVNNGVQSTGVLAHIFIENGWLEPTMQFMQKADYFRPLYIITGIWKESGYNSIVYFAAIMGISPTLYEAIKVDGGNKLQEIKYVTIPVMAPTLVIMIIMRIGKMMSIGYERVLLLYNTNIYNVADVLSTFEQRVGILTGNYGIGSATSLFNSLIAFALVLGANTISRNISKTSLW